MSRLLFLCLLLFCSRLSLAQGNSDQEVTMCAGDTVTMSVQVNDADSLQWYRNYFPINGANGETLVYFDGGLFFVRAFGPQGACWDQSADIRVFMTYPRANDDQLIVPLGKPVTIDVLANDDPACAPFDKKTFTIVTQPAIGTLTAASEGVVVYRPPVATLGTDQFTYRITDVEGRVTNEATVFLELYIDCAILYPNPVDEVLNVTVNNKKIHTLRIYDATGREMYHTTVNSTALAIDLSNYAQGLYMVELMEHDGPGCTMKIMKK